jgi:hypothetical protein
MNSFGSASRYFSFTQYLVLTQHLASISETSGNDKTEERIYFTKLNASRMKRWIKTFTVSREMMDIISNIESQIWWVLCETWCGDGAQVIPILEKIAESSKGAIELRMVLRDENEDIMNRYLTNGTKGIPKLIAMDSRGRELFTWGPRPLAGQQIINNWKKNPGGRTIQDAKNDLHLWYAQDKGKHIEQEIMEKLKAEKLIDLV